MDKITLTPEEYNVFKYLELKPRSAGEVQKKFNVAKTTSRGLLLKLFNNDLTRMIKEPKKSRRHAINEKRDEYEIIILSKKHNINPLSKKRACRLCLEDFISSWPGHRVCDTCKKTDKWKDANIEFNMLDK